MSADDFIGFKAATGPTMNRPQLRTALEVTQKALQDARDQSFGLGAALDRGMARIEELERLTQSSPGPQAGGTVLCPVQAERIADLISAVPHISIAKRKQRNADVLALRAIASGAAVVIRTGKETS